ncbi:MAG: TolB family protein [Candidatus Limnocylindrales bacterium]
MSTALLVIVILTALIGAAILVGAGLLAGPAPTPTLGSVTLCAGGTRLADIRDTSVPGNTSPHWVASRFPPSGERRAGRIAVVVRPPGGPVQVQLIDPATSASCLLVELPYSPTEVSMQWSPASDALAIITGSAGVGQVYIWSALGTTHAMLTGSGGTVSWAPDASLLAVGETKLWTLAADASPPVELLCPPPPPSSAPTCPFGPTLLWSPDGARIATSLGDRGWQFGIVSLADRVARPVDIGSNPLDTYPVAWLDDNTLLAIQCPACGGGPADQPDVLLEVPLDLPSAYRVRRTLPSQWANVVSPDRSLAVVSPDRVDLRVMDLATGVQTDVFNAARFGAGVVADPLDWSPDSRSFAFQVGRESGQTYTTVGLWVVNSDGTGLRQLTAGDAINALGPQGIAWQSAWAGPGGDTGAPPTR